MENKRFPHLDIHIIYSASNEGMKRAVFKNRELFVTVKTLDFSSCSFNGILNFFRASFRQQVLKFIDEVDPDVVVCLQGMIELSSMPILLKKKIRSELINYIPQVSPLSVTGAVLGGFRDMVNKFYYRRFDRTITISKFNSRLCSELWGVSPSKITVVPNGVELDRCVSVKSEKHRSSPVRLLNLGRFDFQCKRQDKLIKYFGRYFGGDSRFELHITGGGGAGVTSQLVSLADKYKNIFVNDWVENSLDYISTFDAVIVCSKFEGVPLVALEAMAQGVSVISSPLDFLEELGDFRGVYLMESWNCLRTVLLEVLKDGDRYSNCLKSAAKQGYCVKSSSEKFISSLTGDI